MERGLCVLTGASKGFGRHMAVTVARAFGNVHFVLVARGLFRLDISGTTIVDGHLRKMGDAAGLQETAGLIMAESAACSVDTVPGDLGNLGSLDSLLNNVFGKCTGTWDWSMLVNNAATLGDVSKLVRDYTLHEVQPFVDLNITSTVVLTSRFLKDVAPTAPRGWIVNVSSIMAVQAHGYTGLYCMAKSARDMLHAVVAKEVGNSYKLINYAPGPLDTDMMQVCREQYGSTELREEFADRHLKGTLVDPRVSAAKLVRLFQADKFASGSHIDFFDPDP